LQAGSAGQPTVFLFSDNQMKEESFLEDINNILNTGRQHVSVCCCTYICALGMAAPAAPAAVVCCVKIPAVMRIQHTL
jgi:hypothetical protein